MIEERDLIRHLEEGGDALWNPPAPPALDLAAITGAVTAPTQPAETTIDEPTAAEKPSVEAPASVRRARPARPWWRPAPGRSFGMALAGGLACVAIGLGLGAVIFGASSEPELVAPGPPQQPQQQVSLARLDDAPEGAAAVASVFASKNGETIDVRVSGLPPVPSGSFYELWALGDEGRMVSLGNISVDANGNGEASMALPVSLSQFPVLDISLEPADGNPAHSGSSLLRSPA